MLSLPLFLAASPSHAPDLNAAFDIIHDISSFSSAGRVKKNWLQGKKAFVDASMPCREKPGSWGSNRL